MKVIFLRKREKEKEKPGEGISWFEVEYRQSEEEKVQHFLPIPRKGQKATITGFSFNLEHHSAIHPSFLRELLQRRWVGTTVQ